MKNSLLLILLLVQMVLMLVSEVLTGSDTELLVDKEEERVGKAGGDFGTRTSGGGASEVTATQEPSTKLLSSLQELFSPLDSSGVRIFFPLVLVSTMYLGLVLWASSTLHWADQQLYSTISELNAKTDQISEGIAALAQIYIDNYPFSYRSRQHVNLGILTNRQSKKSPITPT